LKTKILISVTNDIAYDQRMQKTARTLINEGFEIKIIGRLKLTSKEYFDPSFETKRFSLFFQKGKCFYLEYNLRLFFYLLFQKADIFCAVDLDTIFPNVLVGKLRKIPIIYDAHEYFTEVPELQGREKVKSIWKWVERVCVPRCYKMYTVSDNIAKLFIEEYSIGCQVIYNFPMKSSNLTISPKEKSIMIYQGDLNEGRGLETAIQALKMLKNIELWIIGDGYERKNLENLAINCKVINSVKFMGYISPNELKSYTNQASLGLNLLENKGLNHYYSLANKYFDYIQSGVPPISMNFPEYQKFNMEYECAILLEDLSVETFVNKVSKVLNDKNKYSELVKNCDIAARFYNWEAQEKKLSSIYNNV